MSVVVAGLLVWATATETEPERNRLLISTVSIRVAADAPGTADVDLRRLEPGAEGRVVLTVTSADDDPVEVRMFAVAGVGRPQPLAPHVELTIDDPDDDEPAWTGTLDEFQSFLSYDAGILPMLLEPGERREYVIRYAIANDAEPPTEASVVLVWRAEPR